MLLQPAQRNRTLSIATIAVLVTLAPGLRNPFRLPSHGVLVIAALSLARDGREASGCEAGQRRQSVFPPYHHPASDRVGRGGEESKGRERECVGGRPGNYREGIMQFITREPI